MIRGALVYGGIVYLISGGLGGKRSFRYTEAPVDL